MSVFVNNHSCKKEAVMLHFVMYILVKNRNKKTRKELIPMNMFKKNGGFTLVELIVVIAILAILAGVAVPVYSGYISKANEASDMTLLDSVKTAAVFAATEKKADVTVDEISVVIVEEGEGDEAKTTVTVTAVDYTDGEKDEGEVTEEDKKDVTYTYVIDEDETNDKNNTFDLSTYIPGGIEFKSNNTKATWYAAETVVEATDAESEDVTYKAGWNWIKDAE